tara:strand:- start:65 stop:661 length:597 start_codon:yes stop_codon:yes gene_type:complete
MRYNPVAPPNYGWLQVELNNDEMDFLWDCIGNKELRCNNQLAGNISNSYDLAMNDGEIFFNNALKSLCSAYEENFSTYTINHGPTYKLGRWWVNYQKQTEFNPIHDHSGFFSFVIWMDIPTQWEDQIKNPIANDSNCGVISNFAFQYLSILGNLENHVFRMNSDMNGRMLFFPAKLQHQVYPFFNCDKDRITISGNIY